MLKITESTESATNLKKTKGEASSNNVIGKSIVGDSKATNQANSKKRKNQAKTMKSKILVKSKNHDFPPNFRNKKAGTSFFIPKARLAFT